jgi:N-acyl-phosphatidylethanolamine-hydrolysing phospholipase D
VQSLHRLFPNIHWCVPAKVRALLEKEGISSISECNWWDQIDLSFPSCDLKITAVPAQHFSGRSGRDLNTTLWAGWVVEFKNERPKQLYFAGDTGYNPIDFKKIGPRL